MSLEKCVTQGKPVVVADIREQLNNLVMPLIYHYNTLKEDHTEHGKKKNSYMLCPLSLTVQTCLTYSPLIKFNFQYVALCGDV